MTTPDDPGTWTLVTAPRIHTLAGPPVTALAVLGERVVATGGVTELVGRFTFDQRVELAGTVVPGFNDAHGHPTMTAENLLHVDCSPEVATDERRLVPVGVRRLGLGAAGLAGLAGLVRQGTPGPR